MDGHFQIDWVVRLPGMALEAAREGWRASPGAATWDI